jgi:hypothetical protein
MLDFFLENVNQIRFVSDVKDDRRVCLGKSPILEELDNRR